MLHRFSPDVQQQIERAVIILRQGGIVAYPTDTVYGLGAGMSIPRAVKRVFQAKQRPQGMALPLLVANASQIAELAGQLPPVACRLIDSFLPGALTIVLPASGTVPDIVNAGGNTVAVRIPDHPVPIALIEGIGMPLVGTSANVSGQPSPLTAAEVHSQFGDKVDMVIDEGGRCTGRESTIVDLTGDKPVVLREGAISTEALRQVCGSITTG